MIPLKLHLSSFRLTAPSSSDLPTSCQLKFFTTTKSLKLSDTPVIRVPKSTLTPTTNSTSSILSSTSSNNNSINEIVFPSSFVVSWQEILPDMLALRAANLKIEAVRQPKHQKRRNRITSSLTCGLSFRSSGSLNKYDIGSIHLDYYTLLHGTVSHAIHLKDNQNGISTKYTLYFNAVVEQPSKFNMTLSQISLNVQNHKFDLKQDDQLCITIGHPKGKTVTKTSVKDVSAVIGNQLKTETENETEIGNGNETENGNDQTLSVSWAETSALLVYSASLFDLVHSSIKLYVQILGNQEVQTSKLLTAVDIPLYDIWGSFLHPTTPYLHSHVIDDSSDFDKLNISFNITSDKKPPSGQLVGGVTTDDAIVGANTVIFSSPIPDGTKFPPSSSPWLHLTDSFGSHYYHHRLNHTVCWTNPLSPANLIRSSTSSSSSSSSTTPQQLDDIRAKEKGYVCIRRSLYYNPAEKRHSWIHPDAHIISSSSITNSNNNTSSDEDEEVQQGHQNQISQQPETEIESDRDDDHIRLSGPFIDVDDNYPLYQNQQIRNSSRNTSFSISTIDLPDIHPSTFSQRFENGFGEHINNINNNNNNNNNKNNNKDNSDSNNNNNHELDHNNTANNTPNNTAHDTTNNASNDTSNDTANDTSNDTTNDNNKNNNDNNNNTYLNYNVENRSHASTRHNSCLSSNFNNLSTPSISRAPVVEMAWKLLPSTSSMPGEGVEGHTLTPIDSDSALLRFGGALGQGRKRSNTLYKYDKQKSEWEFIKPNGIPPDPRTGHGAISIGDDQSRLLVFGGTSSVGGARNDLHVFHTQTNTWTPIDENSYSGVAPSARARLGMASNKSGNLAFVYGGRSLYRWLGGKYYDTNGIVNVFDSERLEWIQMGNLKRQKIQPRPRSGCSLQVLNDDRLMVVYGGYDDGDTFFNDTFVFDIRNQKWYELPYKNDNIPVEREGHASTILSDNNMIVVGGDGKSTKLDDVHVFDGNSLRWNARPQLVGHGPGRIVGAAMAPLDNDTILFTGGEDGFQTTSTCYNLSISHRSLISPQSMADIAMERGPDAKTCVVCLDSKVECIFLWCGHSVCCASCSKLVKKVCPICRKKFSKVVYHSFDTAGEE